jgi:glutamine amidotransferase
VITVIDSGVANLASVMAALHRLGAEAEITDDAGKIRAAKQVILPGVGSAAAAMDRLRAKGLADVIRSATQPLLGICLGMQLLFGHSEENGGTEGLGILPGMVKLMRSSPEMPVPHMGWNQLAMKNAAHPLLNGVKSGDFVYFVHSYAAPVAETTLAATEYGETFAAVAGSRNFFGCQFHPERSGKIGAQILKNFLEM